MRLSQAGSCSDLTSTVTYDILEPEPRTVAEFGKILLMTQVYVLYTGGTIGSNSSPLAPMPGPDFTKLVLSMPDLADFRVADYDGLHYTIDHLDMPVLATWYVRS